MEKKLFMVIFNCKFSKGILADFIVKRSGFVLIHLIYTFQIKFNVVIASHLIQLRVLNR